MIDVRSIVFSMAKKLPPDYQLEPDAINCRINWSNIWSKTAAKFVPNESSTSSSSTVTSPMISSAPTPEPFKTQSPIVETKKLKSPIEKNVDWKNTKGTKFVALDGNYIEDIPDPYKEASGVTTWEVCLNQIGRCVDYINEQCSEKQVFLVCSGSLGREIVPKIHELHQVYAIYVFCVDVNRNKQWADQYAKVRVVCNDDREYLLPQLAFDSAFAAYQWALALIEKGDKSKAKLKLDKALEILKKHTKNRYEKKYESMIETQRQLCT